MDNTRLIGVRVILRGCDDSTMIDIDCNTAEFNFLHQIALAVNHKSSYDCQPKMYVGFTTEEPNVVTARYDRDV